MPVADNLLQSREELKMEVAVSSALLGSSSVGDIINAASATALVITSIIMTMPWHWSVDASLVCLPCGPMCLASTNR